MSMISVKTEVRQAVSLVKNLGANQDKFTGKVLRAIGSKGGSAVKKGFTRHLKIRTGMLKKKVKASLARDKMAVTVYSAAKHNGARYGFILAAKGNDWFESEVYRFTQSAEFGSVVQKTIDKEVERLTR
jgi:hypothetical protein